MPWGITLHTVRYKHLLFSKKQYACMLIQQWLCITTNCSFGITVVDKFSLWDITHSLLDIRPRLTFYTDSHLFVGSFSRYGWGCHDHRQLRCRSLCANGSRPKKPQSPSEISHILSIVTHCACESAGKDVWHFYLVTPYWSILWLIWILSNHCIDYIIIIHVARLSLI